RSRGVMRAMRRRSRCGFGDGDGFDRETIALSTRIGCPPATPLLVPAVIPPQPRRIELRHCHGVLPELEQRLQGPACGDLTLFVERHANDLEHATILASDWTCVRYTASFAEV